MKKQVLILVFLLSLSLCSLAQITFQKTFGGVGNEYGRSVQQTIDGGYIIAGAINSLGAGYSDAYLIKTNANGDTLWTKTFGGTDYEQANAVKQTTDGGFIITGYTQSFGAGNADVYLIKTDANGDTLWTKVYGGANDETGISVHQTADGGFIITGWTDSFGSGYDDVYLIKIDVNGSSLWTKTYGGINSDDGQACYQTTDGGYIIGAYTYSYGAGNADFYLIKTDVNGNTTWVKTFGGMNSDILFSLQQTADGGYIALGNTTSFGSGIQNIYLTKTDSTGNLIWEKTFGGTGDDAATSIYQTTDGGYIIAGITISFGGGSANVYLIKVDSNGNLIWAKTYGGTGYDLGYSIHQTFDGGYIIAGWTFGFGAVNGDFYLIKTDSLGNSGCNQTSPATIVTTPTTIVTTPATIVTNPAIIEASSPTIVGSGGIATTLCTTVGVTPISNFKFQIFPNPSSGVFTISFADNIIEGAIEIFSVMGDKIYSDKINNAAEKEIRLKNIADGVYFVRVFNGEKSFSSKVVVNSSK